MPQQDDASASPAWTGARILPDLTPPRPAGDKQQLSTPIGVEEQQYEPEVWPATPLAVPVQDRVERRPEAVATAVQDRAGPIRDRVGRQDESPKRRQRHEKPARAAEHAWDEQHVEPAQILGAVGAKVIKRTRKAVLASDPPSAAEPGRAAFRHGERWKARLPAVVARKHAQRQKRRKLVANAAE